MRKAEPANKIVLSPANEADALRAIKAYFLQEREEAISDFQARGLLEFFLAQVGAYVYNQALSDAHALVADRLEDLYGLLRYPAKPV